MDENCSAVLEQLLAARLKEVRHRKTIGIAVRRVCIALVATYLLLGVVLGMGFVKGDSMAPALESGDIVLFYRLRRTYSTDDIAFLRVGNTDYIKRIVALPGQTVDIDKETMHLLVDGIPAEDRYGNGETIQKTGCTFPLTLGEDEYFVLGDARENSVDSRNFGAVNASQMHGVIIALLRVGD